jgi:hypothetical protein
MLWRRGKSYSQDLRELVFAAADDGEPVGRIATRAVVVSVAETLSRGAQAERPASGDPGAGDQPSRCDDRRIARLAAGDAQGVGKHRIDEQDAGCA